MPTTETLLRLVLAGASTVVYVTVGAVVGRRSVADESRPANRAFQAWWYGLALITIATPLNLAMDYVGGSTDLTYKLHLAVLEFLLVGIVLAIGCLVYYLLYVYTGRSRVFWPVAVYHFLVLTWLMYLITWAHPTSYGPDCPSSGFCYEHDFTGTAAQTWLSLSIILPILLAAIAYFVLFFRVEARAQRYRIAVVAGALVLWFGLSLAASLVKGDFETTAGVVRHGSLSQWRIWSYFVSPIVSLCASLAILVAYRPPGFIRRVIESPGG
ncbi:MAG: hypothetical protein LC620_07830 [Halobacteriales archaeon]|nr:hypothetical protein [Halobacteriales archaeon]